MAKISKGILNELVECELDNIGNVTTSFDVKDLDLNDPKVLRELANKIEANRSKPHVTTKAEIEAQSSVITNMKMDITRKGNITDKDLHNIEKAEEKLSKMESDYKHNRTRVAIVVGLNEILKAIYEIPTVDELGEDDIKSALHAVTQIAGGFAHLGKKPDVDSVRTINTPYKSEIKPITYKDFDKIFNDIFSDNAFENRFAFD